MTHPVPPPGGEPTRLEGHALIVDEVQRYGPDGWTEKIDREALERAVHETPSVPLRLSVGGPVIGQAHLSVDDVGLHVECDVVMGSTYRVRHNTWDPPDDLTHRTIHELSIRDVFLERLPAQPEDND